MSRQPAGQVTHRKVFWQNRSVSAVVVGMAKLGVDFDASLHMPINPLDVDRNLTGRSVAGRVDRHVK